MPHQCTNCSRSFADGSKQMLGGCPDCGGNKFQFLPKAAVDGSPDRTENTTQPRHTGSDANTSALAPSPSDSTSDIIEAPPEPIEPPADVEDSAQASARRSVVSEDELPPADPAYGAEKPAAPNGEAERPGLAKLREELNDQFESIKILQPGEYELNLMELYDRDEYIIALEEDGRYVIDVPDSWNDD